MLCCEATYIYDKDEAERIVENTAYTAERQPERDITPVNDETMQEINTLLIALDKTWDDDLLPLCSQIFRRHSRIVRTDTGRSSESSWIPETESL